MENIVLTSLIFFSVAPIFLGLGFWIYGRAKGKKNIRHNGFIIMMISLVFIFLMLFTVFASIFYLYLNR